MQWGAVRKHLIDEIVKDLEMSQSLKEQIQELEADCKVEPKFHVTSSGEILSIKPNDFVKYDNGKPRLSLIDPQFIMSLGEILTFGAKKYSADNWKLCPDPSKYKDSLLRHTFAYLSGEIIDPESGIPHTACMAFNTMALQWFDNNQS